MWRQRRKNYIVSVVYMVVLSALFFATGAFVGTSAFGRFVGLKAALIGVSAVILWQIMLAASYMKGGTPILRRCGARQLRRNEFTKIHNLVEEMAIAAGLSRPPTVYITNDYEPNAFSAGTNESNASIVLTSGLLSLVNRDELQAVVAHEIAHIANRDSLFLNIAGTISVAWLNFFDMKEERLYERPSLSVTTRKNIGYRNLFIIAALALLSVCIFLVSTSPDKNIYEVVWVFLSFLLIVAAPSISVSIYCATARKREYFADACAALFTRNPGALASAFEQMTKVPQSIRYADIYTAPMFILPPEKYAAGFLSRFVKTHPPVEERIAILHGMTGNFSLAAYQKAWLNSSSSRRRSLFTPLELTYIAAAANEYTPPREAPLSERLKPGKLGLGKASHRAADNVPIAGRIEINDTFRQDLGYRFIDCECGLRIKIPPYLHAEKIRCPKCKKYWVVL